MWKIIFLTLFAVALAGISTRSRFQLKSLPRQRLRMSLEEECEKYAQQSKAEKIYNAVMTAVGCLYTDAEINLAFEKLNNMNSSETVLDAARALCSQRHKILPCYRQLLDAFSPCAPPSVQQQITTMHHSFEQLAEFVCEEDCGRIRQFIDDGGVQCMDDKSEALGPCAANMTDMTTELPEDTTTFAAIETCFRYDSMVSCIDETLQNCPKQSILSFVDSLLSQFRQGTYCHVTLPLDKDEDLNKETSPEEETAEENKL